MNRDIVALRADSKSLELSRQTIPLTASSSPNLAPSVPLHSLAESAPKLSGLFRRARFDPNHIANVFSNDEAARSFEQTQARTALPEYRLATNRVALLVGESALAASIRYIPEETIIMLDASKNMSLFMRDYIEALREARSIKDWKNRTGLTRRSIKPAFRDYYAERLDAQVDEWEGDGYTHALKSGTAFRAAQAAARKKAIIPWHANIGEPDDMQKLGRVLESADAHVTMMNLSNVIMVDPKFEDAKACADQLTALPVTPHAPILTTAHIIKANSIEDWLNSITGQAVGITAATGPWFGLENLATQGGAASGDSLGPIGVREFIRSAEQTP